MKDKYKRASNWCYCCDMAYVEIGKKCPKCGYRERKKITKLTQKELLEQYKQHNIWNDKGAICVNNISDGQEHIFYIALDDSKLTGARNWDEKYNTVKNAKKYIDWKQK